MEGIFVIIFENSFCNFVYFLVIVYVLIGVDMFLELIIFYYLVFYIFCRIKIENNIIVILMVIGRFGVDKIYS